MRPAVSSTVAPWKVTYWLVYGSSVGVRITRDGFAAASSAVSGTSSVRSNQTSELVGRSLWTSTATTLVPALTCSASTVNVAVAHEGVAPEAQRGPPAPARPEP